MSSFCLCRKVFQAQVEARRNLPDYTPEMEGNWPAIFKAISGKGRQCGICEDDLEGTPFPPVRSVSAPALS